MQVRIEAAHFLLRGVWRFQPLATELRAFRAFAHPTAREADQVEYLLAAERDGEEKVAEAERAAQEMLARARQQARNIAARADARVAAIGQRAVESAKHRIDVMRRECEERGTARRRPLAEASHIDAAVERVVLWLVGEPPDGEGRP